MNRRNAVKVMMGGVATGFLPTLDVFGVEKMNEKLIPMDTHAHIFHRGLKLANARRYAPDYDVFLTDYLQVLNENHIGRGALIQPSFLGTDNSYLLEALRQYPDRLRGIAVVDPAISLDEMNELDHDGIRGVRLNLVGQELPDFSKGKWPVFLDRIQQLDWQIEIHREVVDLPNILTALLPTNINLVLDHFGRPDSSKGINDPGFKFMLDKAESSRRVWVKVSGAYRNGVSGIGHRIALEAMPLLKKYVGYDRMVWGSDWPHTQFESSESYAKELSLLSQWIPNEMDRNIVLCKTPAKLFGFN